MIWVFSTLVNFFKGKKGGPLECRMPFPNLEYLHGWVPGVDRPSQVALVVKNPPASAGDIRDPGSISGSGRSPGGGHGNPREYSCLENPMNRRARGATVHRVAQSQTRLKRLSTHAPCAEFHTFVFLFCCLGFPVRLAEMSPPPGSFPACPASARLTPCWHALRRSPSSLLKPLLV